MEKLKKSTKRGMREIFFNKTNKISGMCDDYMEIVYRDKPEDSRGPTEDGLWITQCDDVIKISSGGLSIGIDCSKKDKKRFRLFISNNQSSNG